MKDDNLAVKKESIDKMDKISLKHRKKKDIVKTIIIFVLLALIFLLIFLLCFEYQKTSEKNLTGNVDIFEIDCTCEECVTDSVGDDPIVPSVSTANQAGMSAVGDGSTIRDHSEAEVGIDTQSGFSVTDEHLQWQSSNNLKIFENSMYENKSIIAPGSSNSYNFVVRNNTDYMVSYKVRFTERNESNINMKYRLKRNGNYVSDDWVSYQELSKSGMLISKGGKDDYILEWKWFDDNEQDTKAGIDGLDYSLVINIEGEQK